MIPCPATLRKADDFLPVDSQGLVKWDDCVSCKKNRGADTNSLTVICGDGPEDVLVESIPYNPEID